MNLSQKTNTWTIEPIVKDEEVVIAIYLSNGNFEANEELVLVILQAAAYLGRHRWKI